MTVTATDTPKIFAGNGVTTVFNAPDVDKTSELIVKLFTDSTGAFVTLVSPADFTHDLVLNQITAVVAPATGETLVISRDTELTQLLDLVQLTRLPPEAIEDALDKLTRALQDTDQRLDGAIGVEGNETGLVIPPEVLRGGSVLGFSPDGSQFVIGPLIVDIEAAIAGGGGGGGGGGGEPSNGDKGDITVTAGGLTWTIDPNVVTFAKMQDISATQRVVGRNTAGAGDPEEVTLTQLLDWIGLPVRGDILFRGATAWQKLGAGTSGQFLQTKGTAADPVWATESDGKLRVVTTFTTSGTWTPSGSARSALIICTGAGGGGQNVASGSGGDGGGAGGTAIAFVPSTVAVGTPSVTIGAGGAGAGGASSVGALAAANGGAVGAGGGGAGGTATTGDMLIQGGRGGEGGIAPNTEAGVGGSGFWGGSDTAFGAGGRGDTDGANVVDGKQGVVLILEW